MKKVVAIIVSILFVLSVTGLCFAQATPAAPADKAVKADDKAKAADKKVDKKADKKADKKDKKKKAAKKAKKEKKVEKEEAAPVDKK